MAISAPAATAPVNNTFSITYLPVDAEPRPGSLAFRSSDLSEIDRCNEEQADERALPVRVDPRHQQRIADDENERRADECAVSACFAPHQTGAADHRRRYRQQFVGHAQSVDRRA